MSSRKMPCRHFADFSLLRQAWEGFGCAVLAGAVSGLCLGLGLWLYLATASIAAVAGLPAATQHRTLRGALVRTGVGGSVWAVAVLVASVAIDRQSSLPTPDPAVYLTLTTVPAIIAGAVVWTWTQRSAELGRAVVSN